ncbi:MAG: response regulator [Archangium sp.]|nr:response regulator [Archangium sp.]
MDPASRRRVLGLFVSEAEDGLAAMAALAAHFEAAENPASVTELCATAHSLKGAAAAVGVPELVWAIHRVEALALRVGQTPVARRKADHARLLRAIDLLTSTAASLGVQGELPAGASAQLRALLAGVEPETPAPGAATPATGPSQGAPSKESGLERLSVPAESVDEALRLASSLARQAAVLRGRCAESGSTLLAAASELAVTAERVEANLFGLRMIPAAESLAGIETEVQALAVRLGKEVDVVLDDRGVRADRATLQAARGMIRHLVRNSLDHGLEPSATRVAAGKPARGTLRISMSLAESRLAVVVSDDGRGFDVAAIRRQLAGTREEAAVARLSDEEVLILFASEGGSTREEANEISGRGIGLSAVVSLVRARGGDFQLRTEAGRGSSTHFTVPLEVYALEVLTITDDGHCLGIPITAVERTLSLTRGVTFQRGPSGPILPIDERIVHVRSIGVVREHGAPRAGQRFAVIVRGEGREVAFAVDEVGETLRVAPQAVPPWVRPDALVTGVALLPDGRQLHVLNPHRLLRLVLDTRGDVRPDLAVAPQRKLRLLLAEDSLATREVLRVLLEHDGYDVRVAADGEEALAGILRDLPDAVVSDFSMPRCDGPTLTRRLRANPATARLPVVLLTSKSDPTSRAEGAEAGADAYLVKSEFNAAVLRTTLKSLGVECP